MLRKSQYSLTSLITCVVLVGALIGLWIRRNPWFIAREFAHKAMVFDARLSFNNTSLVTAESNGFANLWHLPSGSLAHRLETEWPVLHVEFNQEGSRIFAAYSSMLSVWDTGSGTLLAKQGAPDAESLLESTKDLRRMPKSDIFMLYYSGAGVVWLMDGRALKTIWSCRLRQDASSWEKQLQFGVCYSNQGVLAVTGGNDRMARPCDIYSAFQIAIWDTKSNLQIGTLSGHEGEVSALDFSADGTLLASGSYDKTCRIWNPMTPNRSPVVLRGHSKVLNSVSFSPSGKHILTSSGDATARVWDVSTGSTKVIIHQPDGGLFVSSFSPDGERILTRGRIARLWHAKSGQILFEFSDHGFFTRSARFSSDGSRIVTAGDDKIARVWARRRPEEWWGYVVLPETWIGIFASAFLVWKILHRGRVSDLQSISPLFFSPPSLPPHLPPRTS